MDIQLSSYSIPTTKIKIEDKNYLVKIDLGTKLSLVLTKKNLLELHKEKKGEVEWKNFRGISYVANSYILPKINLGKLALCNVLAHESSFKCRKVTYLSGNPKEYPQTLGRPLFEKYKLLLDCKNNRLFISNDLKKLKKNGYDIKRFIKVPCKMGRTGLILEADTDLGKKSLTLDTGSTFSALRNSPQIKSTGNKLDLPLFSSQKFAIGGKDYKALDFLLLDITPELNELDGILGMDFIKKHVMYIDFPNRVVYIGKD